MDIERLGLLHRGFRDVVDLCHIDSLLHLQQNVFIWEQQRIAVEDTWSNGDRQARPEKPMWGRLFYGCERGVVNEEGIVNVDILIQSSAYVEDRSRIPQHPLTILESFL